jgi:4-hydroxy-tetrahydrodipicolinate synthase
MFHGSIVALVTPMEPDGAVDYAALTRLIEFQIESGSNGIVSVGTTGESPTLDHDEHCAVIEHTVRTVRGRVAVIAGTGANATREAIALSRCALEAGADACLSVTPYYNKPTQEGLYRHFHGIAEAVALPLIMYNVPGRTGCDLLPSTVSRLADIPNIVGLKEASGSIERFAELAQCCSDRLDLLSGEDPITFEAMRLGYARGVISVTANVAPHLMFEMNQALLMGNVDRARVLDDLLQPLHRALFVEPNPIPVKWALHAMGRIPAGIRLPLTPLEPAHQSSVREPLQTAGIL